MIDTILMVLRFLGVFSLIRLIRGPRLLILCYHGFSLLDEHAFKPGSFMTSDTFAKRMQRVKALGYHPVSLNAGVRMLQDGTVAKDMLVVTIDDGWLGVKDKAAPILQKYQIPATLYVSTYYVEKEMPVFNMLIPYLIAKTEKRSLDLRDVSDEFRDELNLSSEQACQAATRALVDFGEKLDAKGRQAFADLVANALGIDLDVMHRTRLMHLLNKDELSNLAKKGFDLQLHSHRHFGFKTLNDPDLLRSEIEANRSILTNISDQPLIHYCYPSGAFHDRQIPWLQQLGIVSATTCEPGSNVIGSNPLQLRRILDGEHASQIRFEAELCGIGEWTRQGKSFLKKALRISRETQKIS